MIIYLRDQQISCKAKENHTNTHFSKQFTQHNGLQCVSFEFSYDRALTDPLLSSIYVGVFLKIMNLLCLKSYSMMLESYSMRITSKGSNSIGFNNI